MEWQILGREKRLHGRGRSRWRFSHQESADPPCFQQSNFCGVSALPWWKSIKIPWFVPRWKSLPRWWLFSGSESEIRHCIDRFIDWCILFIHHPMLDCWIDSSSDWLIDWLNRLFFQARHDGYRRRTRRTPICWDLFLPASKVERLSRQKMERNARNCMEPRQEILSMLLF